MDQSHFLDLLAMIHLIVLSLWGGVVATEAVVELYPLRHSELHNAAIRLHYWIDLLVELPLVLAVLATGSTLLYLTETITPFHVVKVCFGGAAVVVNLFCIVVVLRRARSLARGDNDSPLWKASRLVLACFAVGLLFAAVAATLGVYLGLQRLG